MSTEVGLRERKKRQTRQLIAETARRLFADRGFDEVSVAEVAREADVAEATVFNYFPTKEDLVYQRMEVFEAEMLEAVRERAPGESIVAAFGRFVLKRRGLLASDDPEAIRRLTSIVRVIASSPALLARERQILERYTRALAALIAAEGGAAVDEVEAWVIANALIGLHRALLDYVRGSILAGVDKELVANEVETRGKRALARLEHGLERGVAQA